MSLYAVIAHDVPDSGPLRVGLRDAHFAHIERAIDRIAVAGPLKDATGANIGSLLVLHATTRAEAEALLRSDPYFSGGVWAKWDIHPFLAATGEWVGGRIW